MAKSIRISDDLYELAAGHARLMHRSLAQQIEHWAAIGQAVEGAADGVQQASLGNLHAVDRQRVRRGRISARSLHMIPARIARGAHLVFPEDAFDGSEDV
jgi:hypothetical protein